MTNNTTLTGRKVMGIVAFISSLLTLLAVPNFGGKAVNGVIRAAMAGAEENGDVASLLISFMFPFVIAASMAAATILLLASRKNAGWWFSAAGTLCMLFATIFFHLSHPNPFFLAGIAITLITLTLVVLPKVGRTLIDNSKEGKFVPQLRTR